VERNYEPACLRQRCAAAILIVGTFAESAAAQHKEDPIGTAVPVRAEEKEMAEPAGPSEGREVYFYATSYDAQLEVHYATGWRVLCLHPCATRAWVGAGYRVSGDTVVTSRTFTIYPNPGPFIVRANAASASARNVGISLTVVGGLALLVFSHGERNEAATPGAIVAASGAVLLIVGIVQLATTRTALSFGPAARYGAR
jgi:hypothetical protein